MTEVKPRILISKCIEFAPCRYNAQMVTSNEVKTLKPFVHFIPVCPEMEIGLPSPRDAVRLIRQDDVLRLVESESGKDHTQSMASFSDSFLANLGFIDGCILKGRSPTCGIGNVKVYPSSGKVPHIHSKGTGFFGSRVIEQYPEAAIEDEGRLSNLRLREHFLTRVFTLHRFNTLEVSMKHLVDFHSKNKFLFMAYNQRLLREAGSITANHERLHTPEVFARYRAVLVSMFQTLPKTSSNINVLQHLFGYISKQITPQERAFFLETLERYRTFQLPLCAVTSILLSWTARFDTPYLAMQTYFQPFPKDLQTIFDTSKGRIK